MKHLKSKIMWPFNRKKKQNEFEKRVNDLVSTMFAGGTDEIDKQVEELRIELNYDYRIDNYSSDDIKSTLLYMTTLFTISQDKSAERIVIKGALNRPHNKFSEHDAMVIYRYVIKQHLIKQCGRCDDVVFDSFYKAMGNIEDGCRTDVIPSAIGEYGLCATNPIPVKGIGASQIYLERLVTDTGVEIKWDRIGSTSVKNIDGCIDIYNITSFSGEKICTMYISPYQSIISNTAPKGFKFKEEY